ncbi:C-terminal binding protein [uncultured Cohaesibacter sp.]|uniref:C-terminal binding protein n=1 Tax=uncultured Cohaesibacter sp. TaxID=1002546 RepID=UPI0029C8E3C7|nr:C-terminal binding protein [uncultured Cohaesibacter sp.]
MVDRPKVIISDYDYGDYEVERAILEEAGARVVALQAKCEEDLFEEVKDCAAIMNQYARVGARTIEHMQQCKVIARYGVGVDIVDVEAATRKGILVTNVQDYCTEEVADHAITLWLTLARKIQAFNEATHKGIWRWQSGAPIYRLRDKTFGIVSFGKIGQAIGDRAKAFGVKVIVHDPYVSEDVLLKHGVERVSKEEILSRSDYLCMQVPMLPDTRHFLSDAEFAQMKPGAFVINTGRGPTIDNKALYRALTEGTLAGAGLDDPEEEPAKKAEWNPADNPLFTLPNVIVTPHAAYYSEESILQARETAARQVALVLTGKKPDYPLNLQNIKSAS